MNKRSENMKRVRRMYYDKLDPETQFAWRSKGGKNSPKRFDSTTGRDAAQKRWEANKKQSD